MATMTPAIPHFIKPLRARTETAGDVIGIFDHLSSNQSTSYRPIAYHALYILFPLVLKCRSGVGTMEA